MPFADVNLRRSAELDRLELSLVAAPAKYPRPVRLAIIVGGTTLLWALLIAGGWGLLSLIA